jgi:hypothetical protein
MDKMEHGAVAMNSRMPSGGLFPGAVSRAPTQGVGVSAQDRQYPTVNALLTGLEGQVGQLLEAVFAIHDSASLLFGFNGDPRNVPSPASSSTEPPVGQVARLASVSDALQTVQRFAEDAARRLQQGL